MPDPVVIPQVTPEEDVTKLLEKAGFQDGAVSITDGSQPMPTPDTPTPAPTPEPIPSPVDQVKQLQDEVKALKERAGWSEREKERADNERQGRLAAEDELRRTRAIALGTPIKGEEKVLTAEEEAGKRWFKTHLKEMLSDALSEVPEETMAKLPVFQKRDMAIFQTRDELDQSRFLNQFTPEQRDVVQRRILPSLQQARQASRFSKGYSELWEDQKKAFQESAMLYGMTLPNPQTPGPVVPTPALPPPVGVPPTLSGVPSGVSPTTGKPMPMLSEQDQRLMGLR